jgi:glycosyltransferase involved in cell wall biosynthesis/ubiquinone/menaquinone biosynthesis C-methylase UbiE
MKILTVLTYYYPHWTGLTQHAVRVAEGLAARGHEVTVLASRHKLELPRDERINGVRVIRLQPLTRFSRGMLTPAFPWAVANLIRQNDVVQMHTPLPEAAIVAGLCKLLGKPLLMTHHGDLVMPGGWFNRTLEWIGFRILRVSANLADAVTSYSQDYAEHSSLLRPVRHKLYTVYPPVDLPEPDPAAAAEWKRSLGLSEVKVIGFAGRWVHEKGFDYLLQALPTIHRTFPNAHLVYAGELNVAYEDFYESCRPLIEANQEHVTTLGLIQNPQRMADFYRMCDVFALPSRTDMMALVQIESMLAGTPVVATDIPGARVVVRDTGFGQLAPPHDPEGIGATIVDTLQHPEDFRPTRAGVRQVFSTERTLATYESILRRIIHLRQPSMENAQEEVGLSTPVPIRYLPENERWQHLTGRDRSTLATILRNEADMAYRRRAGILLDYLELNDGDRVLDGGCGMGFYLMAMAKLRQLRLVGLDSWMDRLRWAQSEGVPAGLVSGGIYTMPFAGNSFDAVLLSEVLEHIPDEAMALREIRRILKPGGVLALSVPHAKYPFWWDPINRVWTTLGGSPFRSGPLVGIWSNHERLYRPADLIERVRSAGFQIEQVEEATHYSVPFIHFLVYGIGKPLIEHNLLPGGLRDSADRFRGERNRGRALNPINLGVGLFRAVDRLNDRPAVADRQTFVNVLLKARLLD